MPAVASLALVTTVAAAPPRPLDRSTPVAAIESLGKESIRGLPTAAGRGEAPPRRIAVVAGEPRSADAGDTLVIRKDDDLTASPFGWEGRLAPSPGLAGPADHLAVRFAVHELARALPARVTGVVLGLDNRYGRHSWPLVGVAREDPAAPLVPATALADSVRDFAAPLSLPPPAADLPDVYQAFTADLPLGVDLVPDLAIDDGAWSDAFDRADEPLDNPASDWLECDLAACTGSLRLDVRSGTAARTSSGDALGVKFPAAAVWARRPVLDRDLRISVTYDVTAVAASEAGVAFRIEALDRFYLVRYAKAANRVELLAATPAGLVPLADSGTLAAPAPRGRLAVTVRGHGPVRIDVRLEGSPVLAHDDALVRHAGTALGIAALGAGSGETWDDFTVERDPDVFAVVQLPPGEDAALVADHSPATLPFAAVLASRDGVAWEPLAAERNCRSAARADAANALVGLRVEDTVADGQDSLFRVESKLTRLDLACPTCATTRNLCAADLGPAELALPVIEAGREVELWPWWWNEHTADVARLLLRALVFAGDCTGALPPVAAADVVPVLDPGQTAGARLLTLAGPALRFTPAAAGEHCAQVVEYYDSNGDLCPDGFEAPPGALCPAGCACIADPDDNPATGVLRRRFRVEAACAPAVVSELARNSLRLTREGAARADTRLSWTAASGPPASYNLHYSSDPAAVGFPAVRDTAVWARYTGTLAATETLPVPASALFLAVHENDGCPSAWSLADP